MERKFDQQLSDLKQDLLKMGGEVEESIALAMQVLIERDNSLVDMVISGGKRIDDWEIRIEEACLTLIATQGPVASDLRLLTTMMKINDDLERINDQAVNIVQRAQVLNTMPLLKPLIDIPRMGELAQSMVKDALDAFVRRVATGQHLARQQDAVAMFPACHLFRRKRIEIDSLRLSRRRPFHLGPCRKVGRRQAIGMRSEADRSRFCRAVAVGD